MLLVTSILSFVYAIIRACKLSVIEEARKEDAKTVLLELDKLKSALEKVDKAAVGKANAAKISVLIMRIDDVQKTWEKKEKDDAIERDVAKLKAEESMARSQRDLARSQREIAYNSHA